VDGHPRKAISPAAQPRPAGPIAHADGLAGGGQAPGVNRAAYRSR
jgi:hypothetical protein